jgi:hypothetical protein
VNVQGESGLENEDGKEYVQNEMPIHTPAPSDRCTQGVYYFVPQAIVVSSCSVLFMSCFSVMLVVLCSGHMLFMSGFTMLGVSGFGVLGVSGFGVLDGSSACLVYINAIQSSHSQTDKQEKNSER